MMSEFWVFNTTDMDFNLKYVGGRYSVKAGKSANLIAETRGKLTVEDLQNDPDIQRYFNRGFWVAAQGPTVVETDADEAPVQAEVVPAATGRTDRSVVMKSSIDPDAADAEAASLAPTTALGAADVDADAKTVVYQPPANPTPDGNFDPVHGMMKTGPEAGLPDALAVSPPENVDFAAGLSPEANLKLSANLAKGREAQSSRLKAKEAAHSLDNRLDSSRCSATTGAGTQCRNAKVSGDYCKTPKHAKMASS